MFSNNLIKTLLFTKIGFLILVGMHFAGVIHIGDKPIIAQEESKQQQATEDGSESESNQEDNSIKIEDVYTDEEKKGYLDDLIELPALDTTKATKEELGKYLDYAERAKQQVELRFSTLSEKAKQLEELEKNIEMKINKLEEERQYFRKTIQREKEIKGERLDILEKLYTKMDPKKAAAIIEGMDKDLVVALFNKIEPKRVMSIIEMMAPDKSVEISEYFGRIGSAKEYDLLKEMNKSLQKAFNDCKGLPREESL